MSVEKEVLVHNATCFSMLPQCLHAVTHVHLFDFIAKHYVTENAGSSSIKVVKTLHLLDTHILATLLNHKHECKFMRCKQQSH